MRMRFILFDDDKRGLLFPFTHTRPISHIRVGIRTIQEKWAYWFKEDAGILTEEYLQEVFPSPYAQAEYYIFGGLLPTLQLVEQIQNLGKEQALYVGEKIIAARTSENIQSISDIGQVLSTLQRVDCTLPVQYLQRPWDIFSFNESEIIADFDHVVAQRKSAPIPDYVTAIAPENIFIEEGASLLPCIINASNAKVYIGKDAEIMEGCLLRGTIAMCEHAVLKMGAKVYSGTTLGPYCKVGGEIQNVVFFAYSNKGHDGYLGNSVIGEWCNLGADTNSSNLKNDYGMVKVYSEVEKANIDTGLQFCGLLMGDHSKCSINSMFNTGTVVGVSCNIFGADFPPKFVPSFAWGGARKFMVYQIDKALQTANNMMHRRNKSLSEAEIKMMHYIYQHSPIQAQNSNT